jgi:ribonuclease HII
MFAAAVRAEPADLPAGVGDSKGIPADRRRELAEGIRAGADAVAVSEIPVERIDDPATNMNDLTVAAQQEALAAVAVDGDEGLVDAGDTNAVRFERNVAAGLSGVSLRAEHGADERDPVVGAASILAKVERESHVAALAAEYGEVGSGYPSDPVTRQFLREYVRRHGDLPGCARESWQTSRDALAAADQASLDEF